MNKVHKYELTYLSAQAVRLPEGAQILKLMHVNHTMVLYVLEPTEFHSREVYTLRMYLTGECIKGVVGEYIGTYQNNAGHVVHVFRDKGTK